MSDVIGADRHQVGECGQEAAHPRVGPGVLHHVEPVGQDAPVPRSADLDAVLLGAPVRHPDQVLGARLHPPQRPAGVPGRPGHQDRVPVDANLRAKPAAHIRGDDPDGGWVEAEGTGQDEAADLSVLSTHPHGQLAAGPHGGDRPALQRHWRHALVHDVVLDHGVAAVERRVARGMGHDHVRPRVGEQQRLPGQRVSRVHDGGERLVVHADQFGGVLALVAVLGEHHGHRLTHEPHPVHRQQRFLPHPAHRKGSGLAAGGRAALGQRRRWRDVVDVLVGQHGDHARCRQRRRGVDAGDQRVAVVAAHKRDPRRPGQLRDPEVIHIGTADGQQSWILGPHYPGAQDAHLASVTCDALFSQLRGDGLGWASPAGCATACGSGRPPATAHPTRSHPDHCAPAMTSARWPRPGFLPAAARLGAVGTSIAAPLIRGPPAAVPALQCRPLAW